MNKSPSFQFYAQDFLTGCMYLTNEEIGMYIKMLAKQWTDGKIPKKRIGFLVGLDWDNFSDELKEKFVDNGEFLINERLEKEREKKINFIKKQSENGKKGGRPLKNKHIETDNQNNPTLLKNKSQKKPLEDEDEIEDEEEKEIRKRNKKTENDKIEFQKIVDVFNLVCPNLPKVQKITKQRESAINCRTKEYGLEKIGAVFESVSKSEFLNGGSERGWKADFDWIMNPNNFIRILEGKYNGKEKRINKNGSGPSDELRRKTAERLGLI